MINQKCGGLFLPVDLRHILMKCGKKKLAFFVAAEDVILVRCYSY